MAINPAVITGTLSPFVAAWIMGQLPRKGEPMEEIDRKLRNIIGSMLIGFGLGYLVTEITKKQEEQAQTAYKPITPPGYYEG